MRTRGHNLSIFPWEPPSDDLTLLFYLFSSKDGYWSGSKGSRGGIDWETLELRKRGRIPTGPSDRCAVLHVDLLLHQGPLTLSPLLSNIIFQTDASSFLLIVERIMWIICSGNFIQRDDWSGRKCMMIIMVFFVCLFICFLWRKCQCTKMKWN